MVFFFEDEGEVRVRFVYIFVDDSKEKTHDVGGQGMKNGCFT